MKTVERTSTVSSLRQALNRGAYDARRAAALSGVPRRTLSHWAHTELYVPSINPTPRHRLWSWPDLVSLRAIDVLRSAKPELGAPRVATRRIREFIERLEHAGISRQLLAEYVVFSDDGVPYIEIPLDHPSSRAMGLLKPYGWGPDLVQPGRFIEIEPETVSGEPKVVGSRVSTATLYLFYQSGYTLPQIKNRFSALPDGAIEEAIAFEERLATTAA